MKIKNLVPYRTKLVKNKLHIYFSYHHLSIIRDDEVFDFIPVEGKVIIINVKTMELENSSDTFVFKNGNRFIRLTISQVTSLSNASALILPLVREHENKPEVQSEEIEATEEINSLMDEIMIFHKAILIDKLLDDKNYEALKGIVANGKLNIK